MIKSVDTKKAFDKIQHSFLIKKKAINWGEELPY